MRVQYVNNTVNGPFQYLNLLHKTKQKIRFTFPTLYFFSCALIFPKNTLCPDYIIQTNSGIKIPDLFVVFGTSSTLMDDDASYE